MLIRWSRSGVAWRRWDAGAELSGGSEPDQIQRGKSSHIVVEDFFCGPKWDGTDDLDGPSNIGSFANIGDRTAFERRG
jgi:hypothetical protein